MFPKALNRRLARGSGASSFGSARRSLYCLVSRTRRAKLAGTHVSQAAELGFLREGLILYTYLHLAAEPALTHELLKKRVTGVAYETIQTPDGRLPLLRPMSEVAGRMATQVGAGCLVKERGGKGVLLGGVPGTRRGRVVILGGGVVGRNAATIAVGMGAQVTLCITAFSTSRVALAPSLV